MLITVRSAYAPTNPHCAKQVGLRPACCGALHESPEGPQVGLVCY